MKICEICHARFRGEATVCPLDGGHLEELPDPLIARAIGGRYLIQEKVGAGGMGTVYRAHHEVVGRDVAIKFLTPDLAGDPAHRARFLREARAANRINHEHIIDINDYGETDDGLVYLVMEFLDGVPLDAEIAKGPMDPTRALRITHQVSTALGRAHELDVVHRDIKPENIYLLHGYDGDFIKILDFGLAHMKGELRLTTTGAVFGTPEYMAPEQGRGIQATAAADLYAVGCMLFEMLTSRLPFEGNTTELILQHLKEPPRAPSTIIPSIPPSVDDLVLRLLEKDPAVRPGNAYALAEEIERILDDLMSMRPLPLEPKPLPELDEIHRESPHLALQRTATGNPQAPTDPGFGRPGSFRPVAAGGEVTPFEEAWGRRTETLRNLVGRAHPDGKVPTWLPTALSRLEDRVHQISELRRKLGRRASEATRQEDDAREMRLRVGRAIDELARDEAALEKHIQDTTRRLDKTRHTKESIVAPLLEAWRAVPRPPERIDTGTRSALAKLRRAGELASDLLDSERDVPEIEREIGRWRREREDLRFQIGQLKGRLASLSAEADYDVTGVKQETATIDREMRSQVENLIREVEPIVRHFMAFPDLRDQVILAPDEAASLAPR